MFEPLLPSSSLEETRFNPRPTSSAGRTVSITTLTYAVRRKLFNEISHFAFQTDIRNNAAIGVRIKARHIARIGITIWVPIRDFKQQEKVVSVGQCVVVHCMLLLCMRLRLIVVVSGGAASGVISGLLLIEAERKTPLRLKVQHSGENRWLFPFPGEEQRQNVLD